MINKNVVFLSGGTGTPKLLKNGIKLFNEQKVSIIGNTGDDWNFYGLYVSPDIDSVLLTLSNLIDNTKWWGIYQDSFNLINFLQNKLGEQIWFNLGDQDAALCLLRTFLLNQGKNLTQITEILRNKLSIKPQILPMANQTIQTRIQTPTKIMHLQEFWVKYQGKPEVRNVFFDGDLHKTTHNVLRVIETADVIILGPSNPVSSIGPILAIEPIRKALQTTSAFCVAISPIIGTNPVSGPTGKFLRAWGKKINPMTIAELYQDFLDLYIIHETDKLLIGNFSTYDMIGIAENILIQSPEDVIHLIKRIMEFC
jgi:LPPG:FO 2-phospho-L-lactate transferase